MGLSNYADCVHYREKRKYPVSAKPTSSEVIKKTLNALPSLGLIIVIMGGIIGGIFTATAVSPAFAVVYTLICCIFLS